MALDHGRHCGTDSQRTPNDPQAETDSRNGSSHHPPQMNNRSLNGTVPLDEVSHLPGSGPGKVKPSMGPLNPVWGKAVELRSPVAFDATLSPAEMTTSWPRRSEPLTAADTPTRSQPFPDPGSVAGDGEFK